MKNKSGDIFYIQINDRYIFTKNYTVASIELARKFYSIQMAKQFADRNLENVKYDIVVLRNGENK